MNFFSIRPLPAPPKEKLALLCFLFPTNYVRCIRTWIYICKQQSLILTFWQWPYTLPYPTKPGSAGGTYSTGLQESEPLL
jgi:hypothetical protein